ncbi:Alpha-monoglucosyldiacylglycerol synthase [Methylacidimicrobium cyclopophantes]|uniref:Alpha-monoglucosyldiacylglycerol synthase n=1 Tax=Methylacidimicrobium cyclopophantes TaxID=1041766 RepID=A0A5E6MC90_9BACT|nr:glycosyltransferase [Methylacidimicrobium cyclopophantes]VVM06540.1 Alpha-monoglucosyldiacylglycerol synthase [Methylacidimicrobium cyclopophantes]
MRLLVVIASLSPRWGGTTPACLNMCRELARRGNRLVVYTTNAEVGGLLSPIPKGGQMDGGGFAIRCFPVSHPWFLPARAYLYSSPLSRALAQTVRDYDLVYIFSLYRFPSTIACWSARRAGVPYVLNPHGSLDPYLYRIRRWRKALSEGFVERPNLNQAAAIHYTSQEEADLTRPLGLRAPSLVVPLGLPLEEYQPLPKGSRSLPLPAGSKVLLFFGRINFKKGLDLLVKAFGEIARRMPEVVLVVAGPDNEGYGTRVRGWLREAGVENRALFTGMVVGEEKRAWLSQSDLFVLSSYTENFGIAVAEAMAMGLPVVISDKVNIWQEVREAEAGLVVPCDAGRLAEACLELLRDPARGRAMGERGRRLVEERFSLEKTTEMLEASFRQLVEARRTEDRSGAAFHPAGLIQ